MIGSVSKGGNKLRSFDDVVSWSHNAMSVDNLESLPAGAALEEGCTIAICTYRRARSLTMFLDSLVSHDFKPSSLLDLGDGFSSTVL